MPASWREVNPGPNNWTLAGRRDTPATSAGDAAGALVQFATGWIGQASLDRRIRQELPTLDADVQRLLSRSPDGYGALAIVSYEIVHHQAGDDYRFRAVALDSTAYPSAAAGMRHRAVMADRYGWVRAGTPAPSADAAQRFFWGEWVAPAEPTMAERYGTWRSN